MPTHRKPGLGKPRSTGAVSTAAQLNFVLKAIETERDHLSRAESLLGCLAIAMEYGDMSTKGPYYPDIAQMVRGMLRKSINALDSINLPNGYGDAVKEDNLAAEVTPLVASAAVPLLPPRVFLPRRSPLRIHRRDYSRALASAASRADSASAKISG